jgi:hypothetical protein
VLVRVLVVNGWFCISWPCPLLVELLLEAVPHWVYHLTIGVLVVTQMILVVLCGGWFFVRPFFLCFLAFENPLFEIVLSVQSRFVAATKLVRPAVLQLFLLFCLLLKPACLCPNLFLVFSFKKQEY